jgi:hypothetical protein
MFVMRFRVDRGDRYPFKYFRIWRQELQRLRRAQAYI